MNPTGGFIMLTEYVEEANNFLGARLTTVLVPHSVR